MSSEEKPGSTAPPPASGGDRDQSTPSLEELDSAWTDEEYDEDATMVAKVPLDLVALSRRGTELEAKGGAGGAAPAEPEKHEAITARPPPQPGEASVVVDVPHQSLPRAEDLFSDEDDDEDEEEPELAADDLDAGWDIEEERAVAADVAAGLDPDARRKAAEARAAQRREKGRAKKIAAREKRKARSDSIRQKQKKPKKRSVPPPRGDSATDRATPSNTGREPVRAPSKSREFPTVPPKGEASALARRSTPKRDLTRMVFFVALVVVFGALAIGLARR